MGVPLNNALSGIPIDGSGNLGAALPAVASEGSQINNGQDWQSADIETFGRTGVLVIFNVTSIGGGSAAGTAALDADAVDTVTVTNGGTNYPDSGAVTFTGGGGSGAAGTYTAVDGVIQSVTVDTPGSSYETTPTPVFDVGGGVGSDTMTLSIEGKDEASGEYYGVLQGTDVDTTGQYILKVHPYFTAVPNEIAQEMLPRVFRLNLAASGGGDTIFQYTLYYCLSN